MWNPEKSAILLFYNQWACNDGIEGIKLVINALILNGETTDNDYSG